MIRATISEVSTQFREYNQSRTNTRLRHRSHAILNKGESHHALARAIFLHQLGDLRNRAAEAMAYRASGLNLESCGTRSISAGLLITFAIIPEELLSRVVPLPWGHISLTGDYLWNEIDRPLERYRPVHTKRFNPKNFIFP
ncbi:transposase [Citrobacter braakii]|nr:transposase [Citrobacter braakii]